MKEKILKTNEMDWQPHPQVKGLKIIEMLSRRNDQAELTCALVKTAVGVVTERHVHENSEDIFYIIRGKGKLFLEGVGEVILEPGVFVRVPPNTFHGLYDVEEELLALDVWYPALV
jgi:quercetin dioxygenase-like cupin family protein